MNTSAEIIIQTRHYAVAAKVWGPENGLPVLAIHGWLDNAASFDLIAPCLKQCRLVAIDLPGHGLSQHKSTEANYYLWEYVRDVVDVMDALGWQRCALLGHSLGASIASVVAASFPKRIERLALIDGLGPWVVEESELPEHLAHAILMQQKPLRTTTHYLTVEDAIAARLKGGLPLSEKAAALLVGRALKKTDRGYVWCSDARVKLPSLFRMSEAQALAFLEKIDCPVCLLLDDQLTFEQGSYSDARRAVIKQLIEHHFVGGHHLHMDGDVELAAKTLDDFYAG